MADTSYPTQWPDSKVIKIDQKDVFPVTGSKEVRLTEDITLNGVGTIGGISNGDILEKGTSLTTILKRIFVKALPVTAVNPTLKLTGLVDSQTVEAGTKISAVLSYTFNPGSYKNSTTPTGITASNFKAMQLGGGYNDWTQVPSLSISELTVGYAKDDIQFRGIIEHTAGAIPYDNLNKPQADVAIEANSELSSTNTIKISGARYAYYGYDDGTPEINSGYIRGLTKTSLESKYDNYNFKLKLDTGSSCKRFIIAYPATRRDGTAEVSELGSVLYEEDGNSNYTSLFNANKDQVDVTDAAATNAIPYNVFTMGTANDASWNGLVTFNVTI